MLSTIRMSYRGCRRPGHPVIVSSLVVQFMLVIFRIHYAAASSSATSSMWYLLGRDQLVHGPYDANTLRHWAHTGHLQPNDQIAETDIGLFQPAQALITPSCLSFLYPVCSCTRDSQSLNQRLTILMQEIVNTPNYYTIYRRNKKY